MKFRRVSFGLGWLCFGCFAALSLGEEVSYELVSCGCVCVFLNQQKKEEDWIAFRVCTGKEGLCFFSFVWDYSFPETEKWQINGWCGPRTYVGIYCCVFWEIIFTFIKQMSETAG